MSLFHRLIAAPRALGIALFILAALLLLFLLAYDQRVVWGALYGIPLAALASFGLTIALLPTRNVSSLFEETRSAERAPDRGVIWLGASLFFASAILVAAFGALFGQAGVSAAIIFISLGCIGFGFIRARSSASWFGAGIALLILFPFLGEYGLWDPWETHYGEVAREILARNDWISLWWAQDHFFFSKPILIFWLEAISMSALGVDPSPDANPARLELAIRLPTALLALVSVLLVQRAVSRFYGARAGVVAVIALVSLPHFTLLARQAITDMPLVACVMSALALLSLAFAEPAASTTPRSWRVGRWELSAKHVLLFALSFIVLPQALYLIGLNIQLGLEGGTGIISDRFLFGSAGNADMTGNPEHRFMSPSVALRAGPIDLAQPAFQALLHLALLFFALRSIAREETRRGLLLSAFYIFCALGFMAKGLPGLALPGVAALFYLIVARRFTLLFRGELRIMRGLLLISVVALPWYLAMCVRHGMSFLNRLLIHDHINRLAAGVHGDKGAIGYFLEQLGPATFPFTGLLVVALAAALATRSSERGGRDLVLVFTLFFFGAFTLFNAMVTKFHHYIFPAVPPLAVLFAVYYERYLGERSASTRDELLGIVFASLSAILLAFGVAGLVGDPRGIVPEGYEGFNAIFDRPLPRGMSIAALATAGALFALSARRLPAPARSAGDKALATGALLAVPILAFVGRDLSWATDARPYGYERLIQLFIYLYRRPFPEHLDYRPIFTGFALASTLFSLGLAFRRTRPASSRGFLGLALSFALFVNGFYMRDLSDHWSQRPLFERYYELRDEGDLIGAWQMNWKGENLYTGNRIHTFINADAEMKALVTGAEGRHVYFVLEHTRLDRFKERLGGRPIEKLTTMRDCNKFVLVRVMGGAHHPRS